jgi:ribose transport system substrate-binding protein
MRSPLRVVGTLAAAVGLSLLPACGGSGSSGGGGGKPKIAIVSNNPEEFWTYAEAGAKAAATEFNAEVVFRKPEKGEVQVQMDILNALVKQGFDGIAVSVINPEEQSPDLRRIGKEVKLIAMDNDAPDSGRICYVGTDNYAAGKTVGRLVKEAMPDGGTVAIFVGQISPLNARERYQGVVDELAGQKDAKGPTLGKYTLHRNEAITDQANRENAQVNARQVLEQIGSQPNVCLVGLWAYNPPAILEAAKSKGLAGKVKIVGFDEDVKTLAGIEAGEIHATVVQDPYNFGYKSVEILVAEKTGDASRRAKAAVPHRVITKTGKVPPGDDSPSMSVTAFKQSLQRQLEGAK